MADLEKMMKSLTPPGSWTREESEPVVPGGGGWMRSFVIDRNGKFGKMTVWWEEYEDGIRIVVDDYDTNEDGTPQNETQNRAFEVYVDEDEVQSKVNEIGETWIKAIDNA